MFDINDEKNHLLSEEYNKSNYRIIEHDNNSNVTVIYFSSHAIYYPNTEEEFIKRIRQEDRYEYMHYRFKNVKKEIFIRDIYKQWYVKGINSQINSINKLAEFLRSLCDTEIIITVGNSAGGYAAFLLGTLIDADYVFDFGGQNNLQAEISNGTLLEKYQNDNSRAKYYNLSDCFSNTTKFPATFYFYSALNKQDIAQYEYIKAFTLHNPTAEIYPFAFRSDKHAHTMYNSNLKYILNYDIKMYNRMIKFSNNLNGKLISRIGFSIRICGLWKTFLQATGRFLRRIHYYRHHI